VAFGVCENHNNHRSGCINQFLFDRRVTERYFRYSVLVPLSVGERNTASLSVQIRSYPHPNWGVGEPAEVVYKRDAKC